MSDFTLRQLQYYVAVADAGSISAASSELHVSQAALSQALTELERIVGAQLLVRHRARGVVLTASGQQFLHDARDLVRHAEEVTQRVAERQHRLVGPFGLGCYMTLSPFWLPAIAEGFLQPNPGLQARIEEGDAAELQRRLLDGYLDAVLTHTRHVVPGVASKTVMPGRPYILLAAGHPLAERGSIRLEELADEPFVSLDIPTVRDNQLVNLRLSGLDPRIAWKSRSLEAVRGMVARGLGYTVLVQRPPVKASYDGLPLAELEIEGEVGHSDVCVAYVSTRRPSLRLRAFLEFCEETGHARHRAGVTNGSAEGGRARRPDA